ncbi:MFS transporter [Streptomyces sp. Ncost-T10-10d]|uniref:MFS transporter n=1 Tax=Streptomyces sp. Ncost-T10-10d TaxID=1839774 RepID=UPI00210E2C45|nr:MFS transporter [Streptomyces sp. Ncost-T10-10d]
MFSIPYRVLTLGVLLSVGMVAFESLGVATVLPGIAEDLDGLGAYGWGLSALMLANIIGTVLAGRAADRRGPWRPMALGMLVFALGCVVAGAAPTWPLFLVGRFGQGLGVGSVMSMAYTMIGLAYPQHLRARMYALLSSAWTVPSLIGPAITGTLADHTTWRWIFLIMLPVIAVAAVLTLPPLRRLRHAGAASSATSAPVPRWWKRPLPSAVLLTVGTGVFLQAVLLKNLPLLIALAVIGLAVAVPALHRVTPEGTLSARPGLGAGIVLRGILCGVYFGSEAFLPLGLQELRGMSATLAGLNLSAGAITWVIGSGLQAKRDTGEGGRAAATALGFAMLLAGVVLIALTILTSALPSWIALVGWGIGGLGMGIGFNAATTDTFEQVPPDRQGEASGALQLAQTLATALIAGLGGAAIALAKNYDGSTRTALLSVFILTGLLAVVGMLLARRLRPRSRTRQC